MDALKVVENLPTHRQEIIDNNAQILEDLISEIRTGNIESFMLVTFNSDGTHTYQSTESNNYLFQIGVLTEMIHLRLGL